MKGGKGRGIYGPEISDFKIPKYFTAVMIKVLLGDLIGSITVGIVPVLIGVLMGALTRVLIRDLIGVLMGLY